MSTSAYPRMYFDGHFHWNPSTYNNDDYGDPTQYATPLVPYDAEADSPNWPWLRQQYVDGDPVSDGNFREWSYRDLFTLGKGQQLAPAEWNFFGGMECGFVTAEQPVLQQPANPIEPGQPVFSKPTGDQTTRVSGYTGLDGTYSSGGNPVGCELQFNVAPSAASAKLIDINPKSPFTSQIFADDLRLGDGTNGFSARVCERMHSRWLYFTRNLNQDDGLMIAGIASCVFQTGLRKEDIDWAGDSPLLRELRTAADDAAGVMLRMVAYDTRYFNGPYFGRQDADQFPGMLKIRDLYLAYFDELDRFRKGLTSTAPPPPCNRAYSRIVGWVGVWDADELVTAPGGRLLLPAVIPNQPSGSPAPVTLQPRNVTTKRVASYPQGYPFGPATAERDADFTRVTVDLCSTIPELDSSGEFAQFGPIELGIMLSGEYHRLTTLVADSGAFREDYLRTAGLLDLEAASFDPVDGKALTKEQFDSNPLVVRAESCTVESGAPPGDWKSARVVALAENPLVAQTNTRGLYVDEPGDAIGPTTEFTIEVRSFDAVPDEARQIGLIVAQYDESFTLIPAGPQPLEVFYRAPSGSWLAIGNDMVVDATDGRVTIGLRGATGEAPPVSGALPYLFFFPIASELLAGTNLTPERPIPAPDAVKVPANPGPGGLTMPPASFYAAARLRPYHSAELARFEAFLAGDPDVAEVNNWVFHNVYETFHLMFPVMDFIGTPQKFQQWRGRILAVTDPAPANFDSARYMPPTRTLSTAQRRILERYDQYLAGVSAADSALRKKRQSTTTMQRG